MENMLAAVFLGERRIELQTKKIPELKPSSILIKVNSCAICGSDLRIFNYGNERVTPPRIIGHEVSGEIVEIGKGVTSYYKIGDRVSVGADILVGGSSGLFRKDIGIDAFVKSMEDKILLGIESRKLKGYS